MMISFHSQAPYKTVYGNIPNGTDNYRERKMQEDIRRIRKMRLVEYIRETVNLIRKGQEILRRCRETGDRIFDEIGAPKIAVLKHLLRRISALRQAKSQNPFVAQLQSLAYNLQELGQFEFMREYPAKHLVYSDYRRDAILMCPVCGWETNPEKDLCTEYYSDLFDVSCASCDKMLLVVSCATVSQ